MNTLTANSLRVATIVRPYGIRGGVWLCVRTDSPELRFRPGARFIVGKKSSQEKTPHPDTVSLSKINLRSMNTNSPIANMRTNTRAIAFFDTITTRNQAENLVGLDLFINAESSEIAGDAEDQERDAWYVRDLIALRVRQETASGLQDIGKISCVLQYPGQDLLQIKTRDGKQVLLPFLQKFVPSVDIPAGTVLIDPPDGLFD